MARPFQICLAMAAGWVKLPPLWPGSIPTIFPARGRDWLAFWPAWFCWFFFPEPGPGPGLALAPAGVVPDGLGEAGTPSGAPFEGGVPWALPADAACGEAGSWAGPAAAPAPAEQPAAIRASTARPASTSPATARLVRGLGARPGRGKDGIAGSVRCGKDTIRG